LPNAIKTLVDKFRFFFCSDKAVNSKLVIKLMMRPFHHLGSRTPSI
jgi:hypothetical protein